MFQRRLENSRDCSGFFTSFCQPFPPKKERAFFSTNLSRRRAALSPGINSSAEAIRCYCKSLRLQVVGDLAFFIDEEVSALAERFNEP